MLDYFQALDWIISNILENIKRFNSCDLSCEYNIAFFLFYIELGLKGYENAWSCVQVYDFKKI